MFIFINDQIHPKMVTECKDAKHRKDVNAQLFESFKYVCYTLIFHFPEDYLFRMQNG